MARPIFLIMAGALIFSSACGLAPGQSADPRYARASVQAEIPVPPVRQFKQALEAPACFGSGCHEDPALLNLPSMHSPFVSRQCTFCHGADPHNAKVALSSADTIALCFACHTAAALRPSHKMGVGMIDPRSGETITCVTCHSPHYSDHAYQLLLAADAGLCAQCHSDPLPIE